MQPSATVIFILDSTYDLRSAVHTRAVPVWLVNSLHNAQTAGAGRAKGFDFTLLTANGPSPEEWFLNGLQAVDQHHNEQTVAVGYSELQVIGVNLSRRIERFLPEFGFVQWAPTAEGFVAKKAPS